MVQDGNKGFYSAVPGVGFMNKSMLDATIGQHVNREKALILADQYKITKNYLISGEYNHQILTSNTSKNPNEHKPQIKESLHMQHVNAMHRHIRLFLAKYYGVSSKYLENYISLFVWLTTEKNKNQNRKIKNISVGRAAESDCYITKSSLDSRPAIPCCA